MGLGKYLFSITLICLSLLSKVVFAQTYPEQGSPFIKIYTTHEYDGSSQVWSCVQDNRGMIYFGDCSGIIEFNGREWKRIANSNNSIVRSMAVDSLGQIYVGASNDFGYLQPNNLGNMEFVSLAQPILEQGIKFYDIWKTLATPRGIYFFTNKYIFCFHKGKIIKIPVDFKVQDAYFINNQLYLPTQKGLFRLCDSTLIQLTITDYFCLIDYSDNNSIAINNSGHLCRINLLTGENHEFKIPAQTYLENHSIYLLIRIDDSRFAIATANGEVVIMSVTGEIIQIINKEMGLLTGKIYSFFIDDTKNLWVCMSKGIAKIDINYPAFKFGEQQNVPGNIQSSCYFNGIRYIGTLDGIYYLPKFDIDKMSSIHQFIKIEGETNECWDFKVLNNQLYAVCRSGVWLISGTNARNIFRIDEKFSAHCISTNPKFPDVLFVGMRGKLNAIKLNKSLKANAIRVIETYDFPEVTEKIRRITADKYGNLWLNTQYDGIYFVRFFNGDLRNYRVTLLGKANGLPNLDGTKTYIVDNEIAVTTNFGILKPEFSENNPTADSLIKFGYSTIFGDRIKDATSYIAKVSENKYLIIGNTVYYASVNGKQVTFDTCGFSRLNNEHIVSKAFVNTDSSISFCSTDAYVYYNTKIERDFKTPFKALITNVEIGRDSTIFNGTFYNYIDSTKVTSLFQTAEFVLTIEYRLNAVTIHFSGLFYEEPEATEFQYQLIGFDKNWSKRSNENRAAYTNLREGKYTFMVKAVNIYGAESSVAEYSFIISTPWYRSWWAILIYILFSVAIIYLAMMIYNRRLKRQKEYLELIVEERTGEIIEQARELKIINQKLVEMDKFKKGVTSMIVHDLKNPINSIINSSENHTETQLKRIKQTGRQMLNMVLNILDVDKYEDTEIVLNLEPKRLFDLVSKAIGQVLFLSNEKNISILNLIDSELAIRADAEMAERVFVNILTNAIKFTPNNGQIIIDAEPYEQKGIDQFIKIAVTDNGMGIAADKINLVFQKFGQVIAKNSGSVRSTGLGLAYCKMVVEAHGGTIHVESEPGKGSKFWFTLPGFNDVKATDQPNVSIQTELQKLVELSEANRELIKKQLNELQQTEFYKISDLTLILNKIDDSTNIEIKEWKEALINAIDSGNELLYKKLL
jgi:signal transduction histidine kinase/ligand-binding sensor domain-containing protein